MLFRGVPLREYVAQWFGCSLDPLRGRQMPCHQADRRAGFVSWSTCVGNQIPQAVGAAWAARHRGHDRIVACFFGDGATSEADFHVGLNFAGLWKVPVVFLCQNNQWSISVPFERQTASETIAEKAKAYGFEGKRVDGNDVLTLFPTHLQFRRPASITIYWLVVANFHSNPHSFKMVLTLSS